MLAPNASDEGPDDSSHSVDDAQHLLEDALAILDQHEAPAEIRARLYEVIEAVGVFAGSRDV